jgi:hypothetical protein
MEFSLVFDIWFQIRRSDELLSSEAADTTQKHV